MEAELAAFRALEITLTPEEAASPGAADSRLQAQFAAKVQALQALEKSAADLYAQGDTAQQIEAMRVQGLAYEDMARALEAASVPTYLTAEEAEIYGMVLEEKAAAQRKRASGAYFVALEAAYAERVYTPAVLAVRERMTALSPEEYPPTMELLPEDGRWPLTGEPVHPGLLLGFELLEYGDFPTADVVFSGELVIDLSSPEAAIGLAIARRGLGRIGEAERFYQIASGHPVGCFNAVILQVRYARDPAGARRALDACDMSGWDPELQDHLYAQMAAEIERAREEARTAPKRPTKVQEADRKLDLAREAQRQRLLDKIDTVFRCTRGLPLGESSIEWGAVEAAWEANALMVDLLSTVDMPLPPDLQREGIQSWDAFRALSSEDVLRLYCPEASADP